jgi:hypothetical protein
VFSLSLGGRGPGEGFAATRTNAKGPPGGGPFSSCSDDLSGYQVSVPVLLVCSPQDDLKPAGKLDVL